MSAYYNEFDPGAAGWLRELIRAGLIADGEVDERSILEVDPEDLRGFRQCHFFAGIGGWSRALRVAGIPDDYEVWTGSPPCQPFSVGGRGLARHDPRHLAPHFIGLVGAARPKLLFGEQVASASVVGRIAGTPKRHAVGAPEWAWFDDLSARLEASHYAVGAADIPVAGVGGACLRQRTFFGAVCGEGVARPDASGLQGFCEPVSEYDSPRWENEKRHLAARDLASPVRSRGVGSVTGADGTIRADLFDGRPSIDGVSARVVRMCGYGNAINPEVAAVFVGAFFDALGGAAE